MPEVLTEELRHVPACLLGRSKVWDREPHGMTESGWNRIMAVSTFLHSNSRFTPR
jgi:hypothetical protein